MAWLLHARQDLLRYKVPAHSVPFNQHSSSGQSYYQLLPQEQDLQVVRLCEPEAQ